MPTDRSDSPGFMARIHAHKHARLLEFLLWGVPGALLAVVSYFAIVRDWASDAIGLIGIVIGLSLIGWGLIPPHKPKQAQNVKPGRRGEIERSRRAGKR